MNPDVSIVIVNWNTKDILSNCIQSINQNTKNPIKEIIVVDNASTDGSPGLIKTNFPDIKFIQNESNLGFAKANNIGIRASSGRYICLMNSDIEVLDNAVDVMYKFMEKNQDVSVLGPKVLNQDLTVRPNCKRFPTLWIAFCKAFALYKIFPRIDFFCDDHLRNFSYNVPLMVEVLPGCCLLIRRETMNQVNLLDEDFFFYSEDKDLCKRLCNAGWKILFYPDAKVIHYAGSSSAIAPIRFVIEGLKANLRYWQKYHSKVSSISFLLILLAHYSLRLTAGLILYLNNSHTREKSLMGIRASIASIRWILGKLVLGV